MEVEIDIEKLRSDLMDYFGTAMGFFPVATMDLIKVQNASSEELISIALKNNIDLSKYIVNGYSKTCSEKCHHKLVKEKSKITMLEHQNLLKDINKDIKQDNNITISKKYDDYILEYSLISWVDSGMKENKDGVVRRVSILIEDYFENTISRFEKA